MSYITFQAKRGLSSLTAPHRGFIFFNSANRNNRRYFNSGTTSKIAFITTPDLFFQNNGLHAANTGRSPTNAEIRRRLIHLAGGEQRAYILLRNTIEAREHVLKRPPAGFNKGSHTHQLRIYKRWRNALGFNPQRLTIHRNTNLQGRSPNIIHIPEHFRVNTELLGAIRALARDPSGPRARIVTGIHNRILGRNHLQPYFQNGAPGVRGGARNAAATPKTRRRGGARTAAANGVRGGARTATANGVRTAAANGVRGGARTATANGVRTAAATPTTSRRRGGARSAAATPTTRRRGGARNAAANGGRNARLRTT